MNRFLPEGSTINTQENQKYISDLRSLSYAMESGIILEANADM